MEKEYTINYLCKNCFKKVKLQIPLGIRVDEYLKDKKCENCGCHYIKNGIQGYLK